MRKDTSPSDEIKDLQTALFCSNVTPEEFMARTQSFYGLYRIAMSTLDKTNDSVYCMILVEITWKFSQIFNEYMFPG